MQDIQTIVVTVDPNDPDPRVIDRAAATLRAGGLVAFPTETVYGLGANALDERAVEKIFWAKGRPSSDPLIVHIAALSDLETVAIGIPDEAWRLADVFWPGPLTLVLRRHPQVPKVVTAGFDTVAVRVPSHQVARALIAAAGVPVAAPSANLFAHPSPTTAQHVVDDLDGRVEMVVDGGPTPVGLESTVVDLTSNPPVVLRPGGAPVEALRQLVPSLLVRPRYLSADEAAGAPSPGLLTKHYSPRAPLLLYDGPVEAVIARLRETAMRRIDRGERVGIMVSDDEVDEFSHLDAEVVGLGPPDDLARIAGNLFAAMRDLDRRGVDVILVRGFGRAGLGLAIWDRLYRAAEGHVVKVSGS